MISLGDPNLAARLSKMVVEKTLGVSGLSCAHSPVLSSQVLLEIVKERQSGGNLKECKKGKNRGEGHKQYPAAMLVGLCWSGSRHSAWSCAQHSSYHVTHIMESSTQGLAKVVTSFFFSSSSDATFQLDLLAHKHAHTASPTCTMCLALKRFPWCQ